MSTRMVQARMVLVLCSLCGIVAAGVPPLVPAMPPAGPTQTDEAYHYSTIGQEMAQAKLRSEADPPKASKQVAQWGRFEAPVQNDRSYANPYEQVALHVAYTRPDGQVVQFPGFYDGDGVWRIRFMPDRVGTWRYEARFSDAPAPIKGEFECVASDVPGLVSAYKPNPIWFAFDAETPALLRSLHVGDRFFADRDNALTGESWSPGRRGAVLDWAQGQGYNTLSIASHYPNRRSAGRGQGWNTPDLWDEQAQRPNSREYRRMERVLDDLAARRMIVYPFAGFFGRDSDFPRDDKKQDLYVRYTLARLGPYWNVLLMVGGPEPQLSGKPYLSQEQINSLGRRIKTVDVFGHLLSVHNPTGDDPFREADWTSYGILQGPKTTDRAALVDGLLRNHHDAKPLYAQETLWAGNKYHPAYSLDDLRKNAYVLLMSAAMINFGDMNGNSSSGFSGTLDLGQKVQRRHDVLKRVWDFFETVPFHRMTPCKELVDNGYCLAEPGREYFVYLERPGTVNVTVEQGPYQVEWINAKGTSEIRNGGRVAPPNVLDGTASAAGAGSVRTAKASVAVPAVLRLASPSDGDDWLLHLVRARDTHMASW